MEEISSVGDTLDTGKEVNKLNDSSLLPYDTFLWETAKLNASAHVLAIRGNTKHDGRGGGFLHKLCCWTNVEIMKDIALSKDDIQLHKRILEDCPLINPRLNSVSLYEKNTSEVHREKKPRKMAVCQKVDDDRFLVYYALKFYRQSLVLNGCP